MNLVEFVSEKLRAYDVQPNCHMPFLISEKGRKYAGPCWFHNWNQPTPGIYHLVAGVTIKNEETFCDNLETAVMVRIRMDTTKKERKELKRNYQFANILLTSDGEITMARSFEDDSWYMDNLYRRIGRIETEYRTGSADILSGHFSDVPDERLLGHVDFIVANYVNRQARFQYVNKEQLHFLRE